MGYGYHRWVGRSPRVRLVAAAAVTSLTLSACIADGASLDGAEVTGPPQAVSTTAVTPGSSTTTTMPPSTTGSTSTTVAALRSYAVVAWESGRMLVIVEAREEGAACPPPTETISGPCGSLVEVDRVPVPDRPHNLAAHGSVVMATHPAAGTLTRLDVATGASATVAVGVEPHDVDFSRDGKHVYVSDEEGRRLIVLDADTLDEVAEVVLPGRAHDAVVDEDGIWVTMVGREELAIVRGRPEGLGSEAPTVELFGTGASPHDLVVDPAGNVWFSNWGSPALNIYDPVGGSVSEAPSGVEEPHHFSLDGMERVWVSDNGGNSVVTFAEEGPIETVVGATPHHLAFLTGMMVVAVSGTGEIVAVADGRVVARIPVGRGLHGVAVVETNSLGLGS